MSVTREAHLGIDIGGTAIKWAVVRGTDTIEEGRVATPRHDASLPERIAEVVHAAGRVCAVGIAVPGLVDSDRREILFTPNLGTRWQGSALIDAVAAHTPLPLALLNDAHAFAHGEFTAGAARGADDALFVTLGTGVGGMIALRGEIATRRSTTIGSIGHHMIEADGELCRCGGRGCLETIASAPAVLSRVARAVTTGQSTALTDLTGGDPARLTAQLVARAADAHDPWAVDAFQRAGRALGMAAASVCVLLQIRTIVLGGGMAGALNHITPELQQLLDQRIAMTGPVEVRPAALGAVAGAVGAALYAAAQPVPARDHYDSTQRTTTP